MAPPAGVYSQGYPRPVKRTIYAPPMPILFLIVFIDLLGFGIVIPLLPFYGMQFGASAAEVTWMMACYSLAQLFFSPLLGRLSDRIGRRPVLLISLVASVASYLWLGFADALWMLFAARLLSGAGAGNIAAAQAYITDITPPETRAKAMGMIGAAFGLGFTVGPALGGIVAGGDLARPAFLAAGLSALAFVLAFVRLKESLPAQARAAATRPSRWRVARDVLARSLLRRLILLFFVATSAFAAMETTYALWANSAFGWGPLGVGLVFLYVGVILIVVQGLLIGPLSRRFGEARLVVAGCALIALGLAGLPFALSLARLLPINALLAAGMGLLSPSITSLISQQAETDERGGILGVAQSAASLARIIGPAVAGPLFSAYGRDAPYYVGALMMTLAVAMALRLPRPKIEAGAAVTGEPTA
ncbi:MAG TPA: MFS transporter [Stellaceae bacterium]|nr:MFS transporter [Stellaceae bacterium]